MVYASKEQYLSEYRLIPDEQIERRLKQASRHIDSLTFNRITSRGFEGCALIPGDIAPDLPVITKGDITVFGVTRHIYKGTKCRNPDGTVNYVRLDVM